MGSFIDTVQQPLPGHVDDPYTEHPDFALAMRTPLPRIASPENPIRNANPTPPVTSKPELQPILRKWQHCTRERGIGSTFARGGKTGEQSQL